MQFAEAVDVPAEDVMDYFRQVQVESIAEYQDQLENDDESDATNNGIYGIWQAPKSLCGVLQCDCSTTTQCIAYM